MLHVGNRYDKGEFIQKPNRQMRFSTSKDGLRVMVEIVETWNFSSRDFSKMVGSRGGESFEGAVRTPASPSTYVGY